MAGLESHYAARDIEARILAALVDAGLDPEGGLTPKQLGALDHFHTGGMRATLDLMRMARIHAGDRVLDIGAGLGGSARLLAVECGCQVEGIELSADYCTGAALLNRLTGLDGQIAIHLGSALDLLFADGSFDIGWMQNVGMNIEDKPRLYAEIRRVLKPGARFAFQEMAAGTTTTRYFPLPWATDPEDNFLASVDDMRALLRASGFEEETFDDTTEAHLKASSEPEVPDVLSMGVFVDDLGLKSGNARRSLEEGQVRLVRAVYRAI
jgi:ubiquinone/menaquinone biosynthesis C-methylase UbiE